MTRATLFICIVLLLALPITAYAQSDLTDLSDMFKVFQESRNVSAGFDLTTQQFIQPVGDDYRLGPGDILLVMAGGLVPDMTGLQIGPQGKLLIYPAGLIDINGQTVDEASNTIRDALAPFIKEPQVQIQVYQTRKIQVYLSGQVMLPGVYITFAGIKPVGFLQNASGLVEAPTPGSNINESDYLSPLLRILNSSASRWIKVLRNGRLIGGIDLAAVLLNGEQEPNLMLEDGDVIYVPDIQRPVIVRGGVVRPGKYEMNNDDSLTAVLRMAGGAQSDQFISQVTVDRKTDFGDKNITVALDRDYIPLDNEFELRPGDIVRVPELKNFVYVMGSVFLPQAVEYKEDWHVIDYIGHTGGITAPADSAYASLIKHPGTPDVELIHVNLKELFKGNPMDNPVVEPGDVIFVPYKNKAWSGPMVTGTLLQVATFARFLWG